MRSVNVEAVVGCKTDRHIYFGYVLGTVCGRKRKNSGKKKNIKMRNKISPRL